MISTARLFFTIALQIFLLFWPLHGAGAQTTQGLIAGRVTDSLSGLPLQNATVRYSLNARGGNPDQISGEAKTDTQGIYVLPLLSPGVYTLTASHSGAYQSQEVNDLELFVSAALSLDFSLRPLSDIWDENSRIRTFSPGGKVMLHYYATDVERLKSVDVQLVPAKTSPLQSTLSYVINPAAVDNLPFAGRDVYAALVLLPGVTASTSTTRGLGISVNGQRPSSSNFLLDGLENNNTLITGPLTPVAPEAIQEYRISTNSYSAQYGRTAGFVANAVTRAGTSAFHGIGYFYLENEALNANGFQENRLGISRRPAKQVQGGYQAGGRIPRTRSLYWSSAFEQLRSRSLLAPLTFQFFTPAAQQTFTGVAGELFRRYPGPTVTPTSPGSETGTLTIAPPVAVDRSLAVERFDYRRGKDQVMARISVSSVSQPDFIWSAYPGFTSGSRDLALSVALADQHSFSPAWVNELRAAYGSNRLAWDRARSEVPALSAFSDTNGDPVVLPGNPAFYSYLNLARSWQVVDNVHWVRGRHVVTFGGGILPKNWTGFQTTSRDGLYIFESSELFKLDIPTSLTAAVQRGTTSVPEYSRQYRRVESNLFLQDTLHLSSRFTLNLGLRYEMFGSPRNTGKTVDTTVQLRPGTSVTQPNAMFLSNSIRQLYPTDWKDWAPRFGLAWDATGRGGTVLRAGYGIFYDQPFDNLWQTESNNNLQAAVVSPFYAPVNYLTTNAQNVATKIGVNNISTTSLHALTMFDPNFRNGRVQNYFYGITQRLAANWFVEVNGAGALGRHLVTNDILNRDNTPPCNCRVNAAQFQDDVNYRAPQGSSTYQALTALASYRARRGQLQIAWTLSHSIDNQSDPIGFDVFNLLATSNGTLAAGSRSSGSFVASFSRQFDSGSDRGNSDFDQRQNLVFYSIWDVPGLGHGRFARWILNDWRVSQLGAVRSGLPYSVFISALRRGPGGLISNGRASIVSANEIYTPGTPQVAGGVQILNPSDFGSPDEGLGNTGRNAFRGPGLYSVDVSLSRSFRVHWAGEAGTLMFRADAFNLLNHANLNNPDNQLSSPTFGTALYGRSDTPSAFPAVAPLNETARQIQLMLRLQW